MHDDNNNKRPPFPKQGSSPQNNNPAQDFGQMNFRSPQDAQQHQQQSASPSNPANPQSESPAQEFASTHSGGFQANASGFNSPEGSSDPKFNLTIKVRAVYGASAFFGAAIVGLFLGFLNSALQGADMLAELGTVIEITLWFASFVGLLGALKPAEFERIFENLRSKLED